MSHTQIIIDFETMAQYKAEAVVLSLGAYAFNFDDIIVDKSKGFYIEFDVESQVKEHSRIMDKDTVNWWKQQSVEAREVLKPKPTDVKIETGMTLLNEFIVNSGYDFKNSYIWSRGIDFDFPILHSLYVQSNVEKKYNHWRVRDTRTYIEIFRMFVEASGLNYDDSDIGSNNHNALDDCISDATRMTRLFNMFG